MTDKELYQMAVDLRRTEPGNTLEYCERWLKFQERFSEVLPMIPLYSNIYFDFYPRILQDCPGNRDVIAGYEHGTLFAVGSASALADLIRS